MHGLAHDFRFAIRTLRRSPSYTVVALVTLALGIGANTAIFSLVNGVLLQPLPYPDADRLVRAWEVSGGGHVMQGAWRNFVDFRERGTSFEGLVAHGSGGESTVLGIGMPLRVGVTNVSEGFFQTLGVHPARGRGFVADEHQLGAAPAVVISDRFWRTHLGAEPDFTNRRLNVSGYDAVVVGVMPPGFDYPGDIDVWYPLELTEQTQSRSAHNYAVVGRLRVGVTTDQAKAELDAITAAFLAEDPSVVNQGWFEDFFPRHVLVEPLHASVVGDTSRPLWILMGASSLLLLVGCTNLASTSLARGTARQREFAVRLAVGAGRGRLLRQLFTESVTLAVAGAVIGLAIAALVIRLLPTLSAGMLPRLHEVRLDVWVLLFTFALSFLAAALFGLAPALGLADGKVGAALRGGARAGEQRAHRQVWRWLIAAEVALALVLLVGSGLLLRSFYTVLQVRPGFRTTDVLTATFNPPAAKYADGPARRLYYESLLRELETIPAIAGVGLVARPPLTGVSNGRIGVRGGPVNGMTADYQLADSGYFAAMGIPLLRGRLFEWQDREEGEHVVVVSQAFAQEAWPGADPLGQQVTGGGMDDYWDRDKWATVVGVVGDVRQRDLTREPRATMYFSLQQRPFRSWSMTATIRPEGVTAESLVPAVRAAARRTDPDVPVSFATIETRVTRAVGDRRFAVIVLSVFAGIALMLACVGIYGVVAYTVARRTREIGIRVALGAEPASVRRLVQRDSLVATLVGAAVGVGLALTFTRVMQALLFEVSPTDPLTFVIVVATLAGVAWLASFLPSLRSTRVDPLLAMRLE